MVLPEKYTKKMQQLLGEDYSSYIRSMEQPSFTALRVNTGKISVEDFKKICPFSIKEIPWCNKGFYYESTEIQPAKHPFYFAGLYYIQEPSAMIPAALLPLEEGDRVLDLCAAPGGKATELAAKLHQTGILVANDISVSRAMALAKNLQVAGAKNAVVTAETPEKLSEMLPEFFDKILIDAPCSGEGMFRRDPAMVRDWEEHGPVYYAEIQRQILEEAWKMLRPGGSMVYSTCTFSPIEDEAMICQFLQRHKDMNIGEVERQPGFCDGQPEWLEKSYQTDWPEWLKEEIEKEDLPQGKEALRNCVRIFPHRTNGEGHFAVLLHKEKKAPDMGRRDENPEEIVNMKTPTAGKEVRRKRKNTKSTSNISTPGEYAKAFAKDIKNIQGAFHQKNNTFLLQSEEMDGLQGLRCIFKGLIFGEEKKNRFEPSPQLALALKKEEYPRIVDLEAEDIRVIKYLKGETLEVEKEMSPAGYVLICVEGYPLGWCKSDGKGRLKNKYYQGWRMT